MRREREEASLDTHGGCTCGGDTAGRAEVAGRMERQQQDEELAGAVAAASQHSKRRGESTSDAQRTSDDGAREAARRRTRRDDSASARTAQHGGQEHDEGLAVTAASPVSEERQQHNGVRAARQRACSSDAARCGSGARGGHAGDLHNNTIHSVTQCGTPSCLCYVVCANA
eukprot:2244073-Prymnesium_polylepis.2